LQDLENTVGSWEMYGVEDSKRYPDIQSEFFERAAGPLTRRESVFSFLALGELPQLLTR
jgi:photosystem I subunit VI